MIDLLIKLSVKKALSSLFSIEIEEKDILISPTKKEFIGDFTLVVFLFVSSSSFGNPCY
jgi:arginyl-tRNA synthetase